MRGTRAVGVAAGLVLLVTGVWAFAAPRSFYDVLATYPPFNEHLLRDIGAFTLGLGAVLALAVARPDALLAALGGVGVGSAAHALGHWIDRDLGGSALDPWYLSAFALLLVAATARRWREVRR